MMNKKQASTNEPIMIWLALGLLLILFFSFLFFRSFNEKEECTMPKDSCEYLKCKSSTVLLIQQSNNYLLQYQNCLLEKQLNIGLNKTEILK